MPKVNFRRREPRGGGEADGRPILMALQMRYLQTMSEIASENNTTTFLPIPIDLLKPFLGGKTGGQ